MTYTQATGKRPSKWDFRWFRDSDSNPVDNPPDPDELPAVIFDRLRLENGLHDWVFPTEAAAIEAADVAYERAVAEGAMVAIEGVA